jgi:membrane protease YdiL (CAAX protease family)
MTWRLAAATIIEITYAVFTRTWLRAHSTGIALEIHISLLRCVSAVVYWFLFRDVISSRRLRRDHLTQPLMWLGIITVMVVPILFGNLQPDRATEVVFALTSLIVGVREEFFYRGILQNIFTPRWGVVGAVMISNLLFTVYHFGAQPFFLHGIIEYFSMGCVMGFTYFITGSLWLPIALHSVYDAAWYFTPMIAKPLPSEWRIPFHLTGMVLLFACATARRAVPAQPQPSAVPRIAK